MEILSRHHFEEAIKQSSNLLCSVFVGSEYDVNEFFMNYIDKILAVTFTCEDGIITSANEVMCQLCKCGIDELVGTRHKVLEDGVAEVDFRDFYASKVIPGQIWRGDICHRAKDGSLFWADTTIAPTHNPEGVFLGYLTIRLDITERRAAEARAGGGNLPRGDAEALFDDIIETLPSGVVAFGPDQRMIYFNPALKDLNSTLIEPMTAEGGESLLQPLPLDAPDGGEAGGDYAQEIPGDCWIHAHGAEALPETAGLARKDAAQHQCRIKLLAYTDSLTGVLNRHALIEELNALCGGPDTASTTALVLIDLTGFKMINDSMGHTAGDAVLRHVAQGLKSCLRARDSVARIGGDEFAVLVRDFKSRLNIRRILAKMSAAVQRPVQVGSLTIVPAASMGVASFPGNGRTPEELLRNADIALYESRHKGSEYYCYNGRMRRQHQRRRHLAGLMPQALLDDAFYVELQPQAEIGSGRHTGFEALARWNVDGVAIPPSEFIPIAEECGLIVAISYRIIDKALAMMARLKEAGLEPGILGINIASAQLYDTKFPKKFIGMLEKYNIRPSEIEVEVTENVILSRNSRHVENVLLSLHGYGIAISLDDFGTGYASLAHLRIFPISRLKIDRSFVDQLISQKDDYSIVHAIISLGHSLGLQVVAEGIETREQYQELCAMGCDAAQGYYFGRPRDEQGTIEYLRAGPTPSPCC